MLRSCCFCGCCCPQTPLQTFWPVLIVPIAIIETFSVFSFVSPFGGEFWSIRSDFENGDFGFDPMGLRPETPEEFKEMQTKVSNCGRLRGVVAHGNHEWIRAEPTRARSTQHWVFPSPPFLTCLPRRQRHNARPYLPLHPEAHTLLGIPPCSKSSAIRRSSTTGGWP